MDFQEAFLTIFWPVQVWLLALSVAGTVVVGVCWIALRFTRFSTPRQTSHRFAGIQDSDEN